VRRAVWIGTFLVALALMPVGTPPARAAERPIQPGAPFFIEAADADGTAPGPTTKMATLGFVFADAEGGIYVQAPARQVGTTGSGLYVPGLGRVGTVALRQSGRWEVDDPFSCSTAAGIRCSDNFALVRIDPAYHHHVSPSVRHWGGPTGLAGLHELEAGDMLSFYGQGNGLRGPGSARPAALVDGDGDAVTAAMPLSEGDVGGPFIEMATGRAVATHSLSPTERLPVLGTTVERVLAVAAAEGIHLRLLTAPLERRLVG
jgi:hypothetical protein